MAGAYSGVHSETADGGGGLGLKGGGPKEEGCVDSKIRGGAEEDR